MNFLESETNFPALHDTRILFCIDIEGLLVEEVVSPGRWLKHILREEMREEMRVLHRCDDWPQLARRPLDPVLSHCHTLLQHGRKAQGPQGRRPQADPRHRKGLRPGKGNQERSHCQDTVQQPSS